MIKWLAVLWISVFLFTSTQLWDVINYTIYYTLSSWAFFYQPIRFIFELLGLSAFGFTIINLLYYLPILFWLYKLVRYFFMMSSSDWV